MRTLGKLLVIWGTLVPLMILPSTADTITEQIAILNIRIDQPASFGPFSPDFDTVVVFGLFVIGLGLSLWSLPRMAWHPPTAQPSRSR
jgi:hypothetical protein